MPSRSVRILHFFGFILWHIGLTFFLLWHWTRVAVGFLFAWRHLPSGRYLVRGLPALLTLLATIGLLTAVSVSSEERLRTPYAQRARESFLAKDYETARICFERLLALGATTPENHYRLALTVSELGEKERAAAIMAQVAPLDRQGYAGAHLWQAQSLLNSPNPSPTALRNAEVHLHRTLADRPDSIEANGLLGQVYLATGELAKAEPYLVKAIKDRPELRVPLAKACVVLGRRDEARRHAEAALAFFRSRSESNLDDHVARMKWAEATAFLEDYAGAAAILEKGLTVTQEDGYRRALGQVYVAWSDAVRRQPEPASSNAWVLLEQAMRVDPENPGLYARLTGLIQAGGEASEEVRASLRGMLAQGQAAGTAHFMLGFDAWHNGKTDEARSHWEEAYRHAPQAAVIANNLAWLLSESKPDDLPRALELIDSVVAQWPVEPQFRGTRGHILVKMSRWKEALTDLEKALPAYPNNPQLHAELAETYKQLGMPEMADQHSRLAAARLDKPQP